MKEGAAMTLKNGCEGLACAGLVMLSVVSCGAPPTPAEPLTEAVVDLTLTPPDARCIEIAVNPSGGGDTIRRQFDVAPAQAATLVLDGLPIGKVTVSEKVFSQACASASATSLAWVSDPVEVTLTKDGPPARITLLLHQVGPGGKLIVTGDFVTDAPIIEFSLPAGSAGFPGPITAGPDGNLYFGESSHIGVATPAGVITEIDVSSVGSPRDVIAGPDGRIWFSADTAPPFTQVGALALDGTLTTYVDPDPAGVHKMAVGADGNIWFTSGGGGSSVGRITPQGLFTLFPLALFAGQEDIAAGADGNLWFTEKQANVIGRITTAGEITEFALPTAQAFPQDITAGADGALWFTESGANRIGRIIVTGEIHEFPALLPGMASPPGFPPMITPLAITAGPDGNIYFTEFFVDPNFIGRMSPDGTLTTFTIPTRFAASFGITTGPDGNIWFTENFNAKIGRLAVAGP
jgi:streptogramin lyase